MLGKDLLDGEMVRLTAITKDDLPQLTVWFGDVGFQRLLRADRVFPLTLQDEEEWFESARKNSNAANFAVRALDDDRLLGTCSAMLFQWQARHCMVGIAMGEGAQGKGYGTDAMRVLLRYIFLELNMNRAALEVFSYNTRAIRSYEKVGFTHEGAQREMLYRDGVYYDMLVMSILRREWAARYWPGGHG